MSITHDIIKIMYVREGYLPNYPYHLISDKEMIDAFINNDTNFFDDNYPCLNSSLSDVYQDLKSDILYHMNQYLSDDKYNIPDWVYSYMIGNVISINSDTLDKHDLLVGLLCDNIDDEFTGDAQAECYKISKLWINKLPYRDITDGNGQIVKYKRKPTIFGEPHVIKSLRLRSAEYTGG